MHTEATVTDWDLLNQHWVKGMDMLLHRKKLLDVFIYRCHNFTGNLALQALKFGHGCNYTPQEHVQSRIYAIAFQFISFG